MYITGNFDLTQTTYLFNWVSNTSCVETGTSQQLADLVYAGLTGSGNPFSDRLYTPGLLPKEGANLLGGDWQLKWGPGVYELDPSSGRADNTAYVVYSPSQDTYIVAIAGTDPRAFWDWIVEDFQVGPNDCVNWNGFNPMGACPTGGAADASQAQISLGTAIGIWALASQLTLSQYAPKTTATTLGAYLQSLAPGSSTTKLIFTGHSLGGALSPTLANWTRGAGKFAGGQIFALPTAGPTPGNAAYQSTWDANFPATPVTSPCTVNQVQALNCDVWSTQDVVPHAWQYIYSGTGAAGFYFNGSDPVKLGSQIGNLVTGVEIGTVANNRQNIGNAAGMTRSNHTTCFSTVFPMTYLSDGVVSQLAQPSGPYYELQKYSPFFDSLGLIHVWGYGTSAFGIDFSVFQNFVPKPVVTAE